MTLTSSGPDALSNLKGQFLASLNHEIRTPLSGVIGMVDLLLETELTGDQKEYLDDARTCAENLLEILNSTLEYSALSAHQVVLEEAEFPVRSMLDGLLDDFAFKAKAKGLSFTREFCLNTPEVAYGDALRLQQIVSQVVSNAIKFTSQGQVEVGVSVSRIDDSEFLLNVGVRDTGIGISQDNQERIFDSFHQLETGLARRYTGMGLGLAVAQKLLELMNGKIHVSSRLGYGSEFSIHIPLQSARENMANQRPARAAGGEFRILVVEDNAIAQTITRNILQRRPYRVTCASSGPAALQAARNDRYDLVLMDLQMPEMDGFEVAERIRNLPGYSDTAIVALTANNSPEYRELCLRRGMRGFLSKPVQASELLRTVEAVLPRLGESLPPPSSKEKIAV